MELQDIILTPHYLTVGDITIGPGDVEALSKDDLALQVTRYVISDRLARKLTGTPLGPPDGALEELLDTYTKSPNDPYIQRTLSLLDAAGVKSPWLPKPGEIPVPQPPQETHPDQLPLDF
jgi:hypothetical protein